MDLVRIYECFCDRTRLRLLHLLAQGPLCVCHFQELLQEPQVKISKHLHYLRDHGLVVARRHQNWMIYALAPRRPAELEKNLRCLQDCAQSEPEFRKDLQRRRAMQRDVGWIGEALSCCASSPAKAPAKKAAGRAKPRTAQRKGAVCR